MTRWYTINQVCELLGVNRTTFYRWQGDDARPTLIPLPKLLPMVRFTQEDVEVYLEATGGATGGVLIPQSNKPTQLQGAA
tara:strand:+ start:356 stop:595 length:240 start_codon:yes stop_codon:yes gene_type:complete